jgi:hypothetical protein
MRLGHLQVAVTLTLAILAGLPGSAANAASNDCAVFSGANIIWPGAQANPNQLFIHNGVGRVNGVDTTIQGARIVTSTLGGINQTTNFVFATDTGGSQANYTAYYVYNAAYQNGGTKYNIVISTNDPFPEGDPDNNIAYVATDGTNVPGNQNAVFLGSYITNGSGNIVPFSRMGDEVYLNWNNGNLSSYGIGGGAGGTAITWTHTTWGGHQTQNVALGTDGLGNTFPVPLTAIFGIADLSFSSTVAGPALDLFGVMDPGWIYTAGQLSWTPYYAAFTNATTPVLARHVRVPVDSLGHIYAADPTQPAVGVTDTFKAAYVGYVEVIHHMGNF